MCDLCDAVSHDEQLRQMRVLVERNGFTRVSVEGPVPWVYTVGLTAFSHPELVMAGVDLAAAGDLLERLGQAVVEGCRVEVGVHADNEDGSLYGVSQVHPSRIEAGVFAMWFEYRRATGQAVTRLEAVQVRAPKEWFCVCHANWQPHLELPGGTPGGRNRAARRRAARRSPRSRRRGPR